MAGAQSSLLPPSLPYRFFIASAVYHLAAWVLVLAAADQLPGYQGGPGTVLAALHALTLGVFAMNAMGASLQILPVVTGRGYASLRPVSWTSWLFIPGVAILLGGFAEGHVDAMALGGALSGGGLALYAVTILRLISGAEGFRVLTAHIRLAFAALALLVGLGLAIIFDITSLDGMMLAAAHGSLALYGFMGLLAMGFGAILIPMFALANPASDGRSLFVMNFYGLGLLIAVGGVFAEMDGAVLAGAGMMLMAAVSHGVTQQGLLKKGMKKKLGVSFILIRSSWACFPLSLALAMAAVSGVPFEPMMLLAAYIAVFGWLLGFVLGVQQQVMPFLAAMNVSKTGGAPPRLSQLSKGPPLKVHAACHFAAVILAGAGIAADLEIAVQAGATMGVAGALAFLWFTLDVYRRMLAAGKSA